MTTAAITNRLRILWLIMLLLTLVVALSPGNTGNLLLWTGLAWAATLVKGWWIIQDFMELRQAPAFLRRILQGWLFITATVVALTAVWQ